MSRRKNIRIIFLLLVLGILFSQPVWADGGPKYDPLRPPPPQSPYGMDMMGPGWQWTFPREDGWPRLDTRIRTDLLDEMFQKAWAAGVRHVRISLWWCLTEPERDKYRWEDLDYVFQIASNYGLEITPQIYYTPDWAALGHDIDATCNDYQHYPRNLPPKNMDDWSDLMADLTARYGVAGKNQVHNWEIWNEPDLWEFWYTPPNPERDNVPKYAELIRRARVEIDQNDPGGRVLAGDVSDINGPEFLRRLMALRGEQDIRDDTDVITFHVFSDPHSKLGRLKAALGHNHFDLWVTELNSSNWNERVPQEKLKELYDVLVQKEVSRSYWFQAATSDWGPGIFTRFKPIWERESFEPSPFYYTFQKQALFSRMSQAPILSAPPPAGLAGPHPVFSWQRPAEGDYPIVGYKLLVDDTLYRGQPHFTTPELDVWVPAAKLHFLPMQIFGNNTTTSSLQSAENTPAEIASFTAQTITYQSPTPLSPGRYYWRVAAVDAMGNVGPYSPINTLIITPGDERLYLPHQILGGTAH